jgi:hypothetical protein
VSLLFLALIINNQGCGISADAIGYQITSSLRLYTCYWGFLNTLNTTDYPKSSYHSSFDPPHAPVVAHPSPVSSR